MKGSAQCTDAATCTVALAVLSTPDNIVRRDIARSTWLRRAPEAAVFVRFLLRSARLPKSTRRELDLEQRANGDILFLNVDATQHRLRGRLLALVSWLKLAKLICPPCSFIGKADDDTFVDTASLSAALALVRLRLGSTHVLAGHMRWHTWNTRWFMHHTYSTTCKSLALCLYCGVCKGLLATERCARTFWLRPQTTALLCVRRVEASSTLQPLNTPLRRRMRAWAAP